jgi:hypothetical protein
MRNETLSQSCDAFTDPSQRDVTAAKLGTFHPWAEQIKDPLLEVDDDDGQSGRNLSMDFTRNHYLIVGILLFLAGLQFRYVTSFVLTERASQFVEKRFGGTVAAPPPRSLLSFTTAGPIMTRRVVHPPRWLGWSLISIGGVLFVFSLTMKRPGS